MPTSPELDFSTIFWNTLYSPRKTDRENYFDGEKLEASQDLKTLGLSDDTQPLGEIYIENEDERASS